MKKKYKSQKLIWQSTLNLIQSIDYHRSSYLDIELFTKFILSVYDQEDLVFFLFLRSVTQKILNFKHFIVCKDLAIIQQKIRVKKSSCKKIIRFIYDDQQLTDHFMEEIHLTNTNKKGKFAISLD